ncbi:MAG: O-antigen ligase family protein [Bacteroidales bacterium]|nr:O-antigen ligase family protein [Bacteroidales bacterium]
MHKLVKTATLYVISAIVVAIGLYFVIKKDTYLAFALPAVIGILLLYVFSLDKVLLLTAFITPLSINIEKITGGLSVSLPAEPLLAGILVMFIAKTIFERRFNSKIAKYPISIVIYVMFIWMIATTITSEMPIVSVKFMLSRLWFIIPSYFLCALLFRDPKNISKFIWYYMAGLIIVVFYTISNHAMHGFDGDTAHWVMTPYYNDHTAYGAALAVYIVLCAAYMFMPNISKIKKLGIIATFCLLLLAIVLSFCRASWISLIAALGVLACVRLKIKFKYIAAVIVVLAGLFFTFQHQIFYSLSKNDQDASGDVVENIQSMTNISTDASNLERINRWNSAIRMFKDRPLFGWGPGTYQFLYAPYQESKNKTIISTNSGDMGNAHSEYIGTLAEQGIPGSLIVVSIVVVFMYCGLMTYRRAKNKESKILVLAATLALFGYYVHGTLNNFLDTDKLAVPIWSCMAIITAIDCFHADKENFYESNEVSERQ